MIDDIIKGIVARYDHADGATLRAALTGGFYFSEAPQEVSLPYIVFDFVGSTVEEIAGGQSDRIETASFTFWVFSDADDGGVEALGIADKLMTLYDWKSLTYASPYKHIACRRNSIVNNGKDDNIWALELDYDVIYSHS